MIVNQLDSRDKIISLNYDTVFEIGIKQSSVPLCYMPNSEEGKLQVFKPHGSMNLYVNTVRGGMCFTEPEALSGTYHFPDCEGGTWHPAPGLIPPRLNKVYVQHPISKMILHDSKSFTPDVVTFWGVGLTTSDQDLEEIYLAACESARRIECINPDEDAHRKISMLTKGTVKWFKTLDEWASAVS